MAMGKLNGVIAAVNPLSGRRSMEFVSFFPSPMPVARELEQPVAG